MYEFPIGPIDSHGDPGQQRFIAYYGKVQEKNWFKLRIEKITWCEHLKQSEMYYSFGGSRICFPVNTPEKRAYSAKCKDFREFKIVRFGT